MAVSGYCTWQESCCWSLKLTINWKYLCQNRGALIFIFYVTVSCQYAVIMGDDRGGARLRNSAIILDNVGFKILETFSKNYAWAACLPCKYHNIPTLGCGYTFYTQTSALSTQSQLSLPMHVNVKQPTIFKKWLSVNTTFEFHFLWTIVIGYDWLRSIFGLVGWCTELLP